MYALQLVGTGKETDMVCDAVWIELEKAPRARVEAIFRCEEGDAGVSGEY